MNDDSKLILIETAIVATTLILIIATCWFGYYGVRKIEIDNFQATIKDLSDEQKCIHICAFTWQGTSVLENYKFCLEKCDRISERTLDGGGKNG